MNVPNPFGPAPQRWTVAEARTLRVTARDMLTRHDHDPGEIMDPVVPMNCGACTLTGLSDSDDDGRQALQPNHGGWARVYVQAGREIPARYAEAYADALQETDTDGNPTPYARALARDVVTFGERHENRSTQA